MGKGKKYKLPKDTCLHCLFFKALADKWDGFDPDKVRNDEAFNDMAHSAIKITAQVLSYLDLDDQQQFMDRVKQKAAAINAMESLKSSKTKEEFAAKLKEKLDELFSHPDAPTKH